MAENSGESKMDAAQQMVAMSQRRLKHAIRQALQVADFACLICWPQVHIALCRFLGT